MGRIFAAGRLEKGVGVGERAWFSRVAVVFRAVRMGNW